MSNPFGVHIDWANDFTYAASGSNVSDDVLLDLGMDFSRGKASNLAFAPPAAGDFRVVLWNYLREYSPGNMAGSHYGQLDPGKRIRVIAEGGATDSFVFEDDDGFLFEDGDTQESEATDTQILWTGLIDNFIQHPSFREKAVEIPALGMLSRLRGIVVGTPLYQNIRTDEALGYLLDAAGWPALDRVLMTGNVTLDWWCGDGDAASEAIRILNSEGVGASLYEDASGNIVFESSTARATQTRSTVSQQTFDSLTNVNVGFDYQPNFKNIVKQVTITQKEREAQPVDVIWNQQGDITLTAGQVKKFIVRGSDPFLSAQIPVPFGTNEVQLLSPSIPLTSGSFVVNWRGTSSGSIAWNADAADVQTELEATWGTGSGNFACGGGPINTTPVSVMFIGEFAEKEQELMTITSSLNSVSSLTTIDVVRTDDGAGVYTDTLIPRNTPITAGAFKLRQGSITTGTILFSASAANIQTAWENTTQYNSGDVSASGGPIASASVTVNYDNGQISFPPDITQVIDSSLMATRFKDVLKVTRSVKGTGPDYVLVSGSVSLAIDRDNGCSLTLTITDLGSGSTLTDLQLRAAPVSVVRTNEVLYPETPTNTEGRIEALDVVAEMPLAMAETIAQNFYNRYYIPRPGAVVRIRSGIYGTDLAELNRREISDLVTASDYQIGINEPHYIEYIKRSVQGFFVVTEFGLEKAA